MTHHMNEEAASNQLLDYCLKDSGLSPSQIKWPQAERYYRAIDTPDSNLPGIMPMESHQADHPVSQHYIQGTEWTTVPWIGLDVVSKNNKSVFSMRMPWWKETKLFFSANNYELLYTQIFKRDKKEVHLTETDLREKMIEVFQMRTPRSDPTDIRAIRNGNAITQSYINELNVVVVKELLNLSKAKQQQRITALMVKKGPSYNQFNMGGIDTRKKQEDDDHHYLGNVDSFYTSMKGASYATKPRP